MLAGVLQPGTFHILKSLKMEVSARVQRSGDVQTEGCGGAGVRLEGGMIEVFILQREREVFFFFV